MAYSREEIDRALAEHPRYRDAIPEQQAQMRLNAYKAAGIGEGEQVAPKAGLESQQAMPPPELSPGVIRESTKLHPVFGAIEKLSPGTGGQMQEIFNREAIPTTLAAAGGPLAIGARLGPIGATLLEGGLSLGGRAINQATGIEPRNATSLALSAAAPPIARGTMYALQQSPRFLPGASAALQEEAAGAARGYAAQKIIPGAKPAAVLFEEIGQLGNPVVPTRELSLSIQKLREKESKVVPSLTKKEIAAIADDFDALVTQYPEGVPLDLMRTNLSRLNERVRATRLAGDETHGAYKLLQKSIQKDFDAVPGTNPAVLKLREANRTYKREIAQDDLAQAIESKGITKTGEFLDQVNPNAIANWLNKTPDGKEVKKAFTKTELTDLETTLKEWSKIPTVPIKRGTPMGSGRKIGIVGAGGAAGAYVGDGMGATVGMLAADKGVELIARAVMSPTGRKILTKVLRASGGQFGQRQAAIVSAALAGELGNAIEQP